MVVLLTLLVGASAQTLHTVGSCPGPVTVRVNDITPGGAWMLLRSDRAGSAPVPGAFCGGVITSLGGPVGLIGPLRADAAGSRVLRPTIPTGDAGRVQLLDVETCLLSEAMEVCREPAIRTGSYAVRDGPSWRDDPPTYTCREGCAEVFGGVAEDWQCSTEEGRLDRRGRLDAYGDDLMCALSWPHDLKVGETYDCGETGCSWSAYVSDHACEELNHCFSLGSTEEVRCDPATEVEHAGQCYYLDGSGGVCDAGYALAPQSALVLLAEAFAGLTYKHTVSDNCCVAHSERDDEGLDWGMAVGCNEPGPLAEGPTRGGRGCRDAVVRSPEQLTLCRSE